MAVCAFPIHVRRMGTCGRAAAGDKPAVAFGQTPRNRHEWECVGDGEGLRACDRDPTVGRPREYGKKLSSIEHEERGNQSQSRLSESAVQP